MLANTLETTWTSIVELLSHPVDEIRIGAMRELHRLAEHLDEQRENCTNDFCIAPGNVGCF